MKYIKKNMLFIVAAILLICSTVFFIYNIKADSDDNKIGISFAEITGIETGTGSWTNDGLNYGDSANYHNITDYVAGSDSNGSNAIVRSFDKITYNLTLGIKNKEELSQMSSLTAYSNRKIKVTVTVSEEASNYVVFEENDKPGNASYTFVINNVDEINGSKINATIPIYVLGAPNGTIIDPKFEIEESTNTDSNYVVTLGKNSNKHYYLFDASKETAYSTAANFYNYLPTVVSSAGNASLSLSLVKGNTQKANYDGNIGRYMNYVLVLRADGSLKGKVMPTGDITLSGSYSQNGREKPVLKQEFIRLYNGQKVGDIDSVSVSSPYSATTIVSRDKYTRNPGSIEVSNITDNSFSLKIKNFGMSYSYPTSNADGSGSTGSVIGSYAITLFSPRVALDESNNINVNLSFAASEVQFPGGPVPLNAVSETEINDFYATSDYSLKTRFYEMGATNAIGDMNGTGAKSKGSEIEYVTEFNYSTTANREGLKEIIKIDPVAYRFMPLSPERDIDIHVYCGDKECSGIKTSDFEIAFVAGDFNNSNYTAVNYEQVDSRIREEDVNKIKTGCNTVKNNLSNYNSDQIMNLYGGPCISENSPQTYRKLSDAVTSDNNEIIVSKLIVQTKNGVKLPDKSRVVIRTKLRIRNVSDLTRTYQATAIATSSDYDSKLTYYTPSVTNSDPSDICTNPNSYIKTNYSNYYRDNSLFGDSLKILSFEAKQNIIVTNKKKDGKMKTNFNAVDNETIQFKVASNLNDFASTVGADDTWFIKDLRVYINIPNTLTYIPNEYEINPVNVFTNGGGTLLEYVIPYSKPNQPIPDIYFDTVLSPNLVGNGNEIEVSSEIYGRNINDEDIDYLHNYSSIKIYGNGINNMILTLVNDGNTKVEKDEEFSYYINAFNNTSDIINDYIIMNILPSNNDERGSSYNGSYKVHLSTDSLGSAKVYCSTMDSRSLKEDVLDEENEFIECTDIFDDGVYKEITAFKITNISADSYTSINPIKVTIQPVNNKFSDAYETGVIGGSETYMTIKSNKLRFEVINRKITGKVFIDVEEDGVQVGKEKPLENIPVTLYRIIDELNQEYVKETTTLSSGVYTFDNLEKGFYKVRFNYDDSEYDLTLRYATEDTSIDSDAYKITNGVAEITNKHDPYTHDGIDLVTNTEATHMDMGLINRKPFSMSIKKYITKIDLSYNGIVDTKNYNNESKVLLNVRNSLKATAKVYYGFEIINDSQVAGYVENIYEDIPEGLLFDTTDPYNAGWVLVDNKLQNTSFQGRVINPGESIYAQIALNMPSREEAGAFLNTVTLDIKAADPIEETKESSIDNSTEYVVGEEVTYAGLNWHVINAIPSGDDQTLTLLLDASSANNNGTLGTDIYKWSNVGFEVPNALLNASSLFEDSYICDDASGLVNGSYGGSLRHLGTCTSNQYVTSKIRLLTIEEFRALLNLNLADNSWIYGNKDYYLQTSVNIPTEYSETGAITTNYSNYVRFVDVANSAVGMTSITPVNKAFRYVITINSKYILNY